MKLNRVERWFVNSPMRRAMQALVVRWFRGIRPLPVGVDILEIGCGSGFGARMIAAQFAPRRLFLSDLDSRMVALARQAILGEAAARTGFCVADAEALPFRSRAADAVFGFAHPLHDRFRSHDLRGEFEIVGLKLRQALELKRLGILGVGVKEPSC